MHAFLRGELQVALRITVDAVPFFPPPFSVQAYRNGVARKVFDSSAIPGEIFDALVVSSDFSATHGEMLARLGALSAISRSCMRCRKSPSW